MDRKLILYIVLLALVTGLIIYADSNKPKPINWQPTYNVKHKIPFGLYVFDKEAPHMFSGQKIRKLLNTPYEYFDKLYDYKARNYKVKGTFISIDEQNMMDEQSVKELIYFAEHGNTVFLSMKNLPPIILDTLDLDVGAIFLVKDSIGLSAEGKQAAKKYWFSEGAGFTYFDSLDLKKISVLGYQQMDTVLKPNFIKVPFGYGDFVLHTQPAAFSNFHLLKNDHYKYTQDILSHVPDGDIFWYSRHFGSGESSSDLRYILSQPALKSALYLGLIALLIFIFFNAKRKQRIIPQIHPVRNTTVDFVKTIGNLYFQEGDHNTIIEKKIIYFLEKIRNEYLIDTYSLNDDFVEKLHQKTGKPVEDIQKTVSLIKKHRHQFQSTEADVIEISKAIENLRL